jgi:hypothetical protein
MAEDALRRWLLHPLASIHSLGKKIKYKLLNRGEIFKCMRQEASFDIGGLFSLQSAHAYKIHMAGTWAAFTRTKKISTILPSFFIMVVLQHNTS